MLKLIPRYVDRGGAIDFEAGVVYAAVIIDNLQVASTSDEIRQDADVRSIRSIRQEHVVVDLDTVAGALEINARTNDVILYHCSGEAAIRVASIACEDTIAASRCGRSEVVPFYEAVCREGLTGVGCLEIQRVATRALPVQPADEEPIDAHLALTVSVADELDDGDRAASSSCWHNDTEVRNAPDNERASELETPVIRSVARNDAAVRAGRNVERDASSDGSIPCSLYRCRIIRHPVALGIIRRRTGIYPDIAGGANDGVELGVVAQEERRPSWPNGEAEQETKCCDQFTHM